MTQPDIDRLKAALISAPGCVYSIPFLYPVLRIEMRESFGQSLPVAAIRHRDGDTFLEIGNLSIDDFRIINPIP